MNKSRSLLTSEKGQGLVEYILLLVVVVTIALTFMNLFFKPYARWAQQHIGGYVECLLDQGELPGLGGDSGVKDCDLADAGFEGGGKSTGSRSKGSTDDVARDNKDKSSDSKDRGAGDGSGGTILGTARDSGMKMRRLGGTDGHVANAKSINLGSSSNGQSSGNLKISGHLYQIRSDGSKKEGGAFLAGMLEAEKEKIKKREAKTQKMSASEGGTASNQAKKFAVEQKQRKPADTDFSSDGWSFGKLFRILLIIVIIIALVLFIGGQVMQISKGMEK